MYYRNASGSVLIIEFLQIQITIDRTSGTRTRATQMLTNTIVEICSTPLTTAPRRPSDITKPSPTNSSDALDYPMTKDRLDNASYILKPFKACGIDGLSSEMIMCLLQINPNTFLKLCNACISTIEAITS